jgi:tetratricopeptide (TPR) repeat protein
LKHRITALVLLAASTAFAADVDRERLRRVAELPTVGEGWWFYSQRWDGRVIEGGDGPEIADVASLRAELTGNDVDAERWMDLAAAARRWDDSALAKEATTKAVEILRRRAKEHADDGRPLAALGLALFAAGDDAGADETIGRAERAATAGWAGTAASADLLVLRDATRAAGKPVRSFDDLPSEWETSDAPPVLDPKATDEAMRRYDAAAAAVESSGATGREASSVYVRRNVSRGLRRLSGAPKRDENANQVFRRGVGLQPSEPYAVLLIGLDDAMSEPDKDGSRHVEYYGRLSETAKTNVIVDFARLRDLAQSSDATVAGRALQAIACMEWFCLHDAERTTATLRRAIAMDPHLTQSWIALESVLAQTAHWDELAETCRGRLALTGAAYERLRLGKALWLAGRAEEGEREWRTGLAAAPNDPVAILGAAVFVIRRAKDDAALADAAKFVRAASAVATSDGSKAACRLIDAVVLGLQGDVDRAATEAKELAASPQYAASAREILTALGRQ